MANFSWTPGPLASSIALSILYGLSIPYVLSALFAFAKWFIQAKNHTKEASRDDGAPVAGKQKVLSARRQEGDSISPQKTFFPSTQPVSYPEPQTRGFENPVIQKDLKIFIQKSLDAPEQNFLEMELPFEFDDDQEKWFDWKTEMIGWINGNNARFRNKSQALYQFVHCIKLGTRARDLITAIMASVQTGGPHKIRFDALETPIEIWMWLLEVLHPLFFDAKAIDKAQAMSVGAQDGRPVQEYLKDVQTGAARAGHSIEMVEAHLRLGMDFWLLSAIARRLRKDEFELTYDDFFQSAHICEYDHNRAIERRSSREQEEETELIDLPAPRATKMYTSWSKEDWNLIIANGWCKECGFAGHEANNCRNKNRPGGWSKKLGPKQKSQIPCNDKDQHHGPKA
ncbi:hypothetical protein TWF281_010540 [Arthrobotrys megalospora]